MENILEEIYKSSLKLLEPLDPEDTYALVVKEAVKLVEADFGSLLIIKGGELKQVYSTLPINLKRRKKGFAYRAFKENKTYVLPKDIFGKTHPVLGRLGLKSNIYISISYRNKSIGVLIVNSKKEKHFNKKQLRILQLYGSMASLAIRKTELFAEAQKALTIRDQFIPLAAHELRTPITAISGYIQLLHKKLSNHNGAEGKWIRELDLESKRLTRLVTGLVEINRINSDQFNLNLREYQVDELVGIAISKFHQFYPERKVNIINQITSHQVKIIGDLEKLVMVLVHLLENAAKFSAQDAKIDLWIKSQDKTITISVQDYGDGISKADLNNIFDGFYKGQFFYKTGLGLGLFLAKNVVDKHKGSIAIHSKLKKGTQVIIKLPKVKL
ncbi:GAF domain-containing protein [Candidatus Daviesbacteria bacterium]|nr:GAF domain-containing protein [Candidatus Daviesbacteria bacterium]